MKEFEYKHKDLIDHPKNDIGLFNDLVEKYEKFGCLYIGVDFDNTLLRYGDTELINESGELVTPSGYWRIIELLRELKKIGCKLCLWSLSTSQENLEWKIQWCKNYRIEMDYVNETPLLKEYVGVVSQKPHFNVLLDDVAGLETVYSVLFNLVQYVHQNQ